MKKLSLAALAIAWMVPFSNVLASDIFYTIFNKTTPNGFEIAISTITKRLTYECVIETRACTLLAEVVAPRIETPLKEVTKDELPPPSPPITNFSWTPLVPVKAYPQFNYPNDAKAFKLSPDKEKLAYMVNGPGYIKPFNEYVVVDDQGKEWRRMGLISKGWELVSDNGKLFDFTGDSRKLVYLDDQTGFQQLYIADVTNGSLSLNGTPLITKAYTVVDFAVHENEVFFIANRENQFQWNLYSLNLSTRKLALISNDVLYTNNLVMVGDNLIFTFMKEGAGVLKAFDTKKREVFEFSGLISETVPRLNTEVVTNELTTGLFMPSKTTSNKAVIWLHGGPYRQSAIHRHPYGSYATYDWMLDEMVESGVNVYKLEYPGSFGQGRDYATNIVGNVGYLDVIAVDSAVSFLRGKGIDEIYVFGNSYGGYLALKSLAELPEKIKGAVAVAPVTDWRELVERIILTPFVAHFGGMPNEINEPLYEQADVIKKLDEISNPAIVFHGNLDRQVPFQQSEFLLRNLKKNTNVRYFSVQDQPHVISGVSQNEAICGSLAEFLGVSSRDQDFCRLD